MAWRAGLLSSASWASQQFDCNWRKVHRLSLPLAHRFKPELPRHRPGIPGGFDPHVLWLMIVFEAAANGGGLENSTLMMVDEVNQ
jgi:hypothetical protein